jgi:predicted enzyme related to lactoylglutathione lyase
MCRTTLRVRNLLEAARAEARRRGDRHLGTEHLVLAMLGDEGGIAGSVLRQHSNPEDLRAAVDGALASSRSVSTPLPGFEQAVERDDGSLAVLDQEGNVLATARQLRAAGVTGPYVELPAADMDRALAFYRDGLGLRARSRSFFGRGGWARLSWGDAMLVLDARAGAGSVGFEVTNLEEACAAVTLAGGRVVSAPDHFGRATVADPEGNLLILSQWQADPYAVSEPAFLEVVESALTAKGALCVAHASFGGPDHTWFLIESMDQFRGVLARGEPSDRFVVSTRPWHPVRGRADEPEFLTQALQLVKIKGWDGILLATRVGEDAELADAEFAVRGDEVREWFMEHAAAEVLIAPNPFWPRDGEIVAYVPDAGGTVVVGSY